MQGLGKYMIYVKWFETSVMQPHGDVGGTAKNMFQVIAETENELICGSAGLTETIWSSVPRFCQTGIPLHPLALFLPAWHHPSCCDINPVSIKAKAVLVLVGKNALLFSTQLQLIELTDCFPAYIHSWKNSLWEGLFLKIPFISPG